MLCGIDTPLRARSRATLLSAELGGRAIKSRSDFRISSDCALHGVSPVPPELARSVMTVPAPLHSYAGARARRGAGYRSFARRSSHSCGEVGWLRPRGLRSTLGALGLASEPACAGACSFLRKDSDRADVGSPRSRLPVIGGVHVDLWDGAQCPPGTAVTSTMTANAALDARSREHNACRNGFWE